LDSAAPDETVSRLVDHLFRHECGKLTAVLTRIFGSHHLELAEDVVQDALLEAIHVWNFKGVPENPTSWLYKVAKNKALNIVNRDQYKRKYSSEVSHFLKSEWTAGVALDNLFSDAEIKDDQLRMMFTCCHPSISSDSQVSLTLKTLCGFSIQEIARGFLTTDENITKRLKRARQTIRENKIAFEVPAGEQLSRRLDAVLQTIYLLFNEGYSASGGHDLIRFELCAEAIRLAEIIASHPAISFKTNVYACLALMFLNACRFAARQNEQGEILTMSEQDRTKWDKNLMQKGYYYLDLSTHDKIISTYHILATISAFHCSAKNFESTDWASILSLYDKLLVIDRSAVVKLNRAIAASKIHGPEKVAGELLLLQNDAAMRSYNFFYTTLAELHVQINKIPEAIQYLKTAMALSSIQAEKKLLQKRIEKLSSTVKTR
jgi:RNA polymerase sigma factor (sigma-70 family)